MKKDPIKKIRVKNIEAYKRGDISKADAEATIVIAEHDDHFNRKGETWDYPDGVDSFGKNELLTMVLPAMETTFKSAMIKILQNRGRNPKSKIEDSIAIIIYSSL